jgi:hypothetical protein
MGKYSKLRGKLPAFENESSYQAKVEEEKTLILDDADNNEDANVTRLSALFATVTEAKRAAEEKVSAYNVQLEALSQLIVDALTNQGIEKVSLANGATVYLQDGTYPGIEDETKFYGWLHKQKMDNLLSLNYQTLKGIVNEYLQSGKPLPPGTRCFLKTQARVRNGNSNEE